MKELVFSVDFVELRRLKGDPPKLEICARGVLRGGYTNAQLIQYESYPSPPEGGIWNYDFVAEASRQPSTQRRQPVEVKAILSTIPDGLKGIRVRSETNSLAGLL